MINISPKEIRDIVAEYEYKDDPMDEDEPRVRQIKWALTQIAPADKILFCLYMDKQSSRTVGKIIGVSHNIILKEINKIKKQIQDICGGILS